MTWAVCLQLQTPSRAEMSAIKTCKHPCPCFLFSSAWLLFFFFFLHCLVSVRCCFGFCSFVFVAMAAVAAAVLSLGFLLCLPYLTCPVCPLYFCLCILQYQVQGLAAAETTKQKGKGAGHRPEKSTAKRPKKQGHPARHKRAITAA